MTALQAHLTSEDHAGLAFHPACPVCRRERLRGHIPTNAIVGPRARALLAAGILAGSTGASTAGAVASTPEEAELGGLLDELGSVPATPEEQAEIDAEAGVPDEPEDAPDPAPPEVPAEPAPPVPPPQPPPVAPAPAPATPPAPPPTAVQTAPVAKEAPAPVAKRKGRGAKRPVAAPAPVPAPVPAPAPAAPVSAAPPAGGPPRAAGTSHVVCAGESLWSIARDLLGPRTGNARVAIEVARIWDLNASAIGTGDPDLVMAGQRLRLPGHD